MSEEKKEGYVDQQKRLITFTQKERRRRPRSQLKFRFHRDIDVALPHAKGFLVMRVFRPIKAIRPDFRVGLLRMEMRGGETLPVYTGSVDTDFPRVEDLDAQALYYALGDVKAELSALQSEWEENTRGRRSIYRNLGINPYGVVAEEETTAASFEATVEALADEQEAVEAVEASEPASPKFSFTPMPKPRPLM